MLKRNLIPLLRWLGYTRRERRSSAILIILIALTFIAGKVFPPVKNEGSSLSIVAKVTDSVSIKVNSKNLASSAKTKNVKFSGFPGDSIDINSADSVSLVKLPGIGPVLAGRIVKYRNNVARFRQPMDLSKIYGIDSMLAERLIPFICIGKIINDTLKNEKKIDGKFLPAVKSSLKIELNSCDSTGFETEFGVKHFLAVRITKYRELLGGYIDMGQLLEVYGMSESIQKQIAAGSYIDSSYVRKIRINAVGYRELERHPYIERNEAQAIIKYRELAGRIKDIKDLVNNQLLTRDKAKKIEAYLMFQ